MRRAAAIAAGLLALAACKVDVEGAPCATPGETIDCPSGQACGNDRRCSARAASCTPCTPGQSLCAGGDGTVLARQCTDADPVCGSWVEKDCGALGLVCGSKHGDGDVDCFCPSFGGPVFAADPVAGSPSDAPPYATGAESPAACRFRRLGEAIAAAGAVAASGAATVQAYAAPDQARVVFGDTATGDGAIAIPANVTVVGAATARTSLRLEDVTDGPLVTLQGALRAFDVESAAATGTAVAASCGATGKPSLTDVAVDGGGALGAGVDVSGSCGADLSGVSISRVAGPALRIRADASAPVSVRGGVLRDSGVGARITGGDATFGVDGDPTAAVEITANASEGVVVATGAATDVRLHGAAVHANGGTGIVVDRAAAGSAVVVRGCDVYANGGAAPRSYGPDGSTRAVGGVFVTQEVALPFAFSANRVYGNAGDQLAFESSDPGWSIAPASCGPSSNVFACVPAGAYAVAVEGGGHVDARYTVWPGVPFSGYVSAGVSGSYCTRDQAGVPSTPACPPP